MGPYILLFFYSPFLLVLDPFSLTRCVDPLCCFLLAGSVICHKTKQDVLGIRKTGPSCITFQLVHPTKRQLEDLEMEFDFSDGKVRDSVFKVSLKTCLFVALPRCFSLETPPRVEFFPLCRGWKSKGLFFTLGSIFLFYIKLFSMFTRFLCS